jgi:hypothetical protein
VPVDVDITKVLNHGKFECNHKSAVAGVEDKQPKLRSKLCSSTVNSDVRLGAALLLSYLGLEHIATLARK